MKKPKPKFDPPFLPNHSKIPFHTIHIDFGELEKKSELNKSTKSFLLLVDEATRIVVGKAMKESSLAVINFLNSFSRIDQVKVIVSDNGTAFTSKEMKNWAQLRNISLRNSAPYHPAANGLVERKMRDIKTFIGIYKDSGVDWKTRLASATAYSNRSYHSVIGCTPWYKLYGKSPLLPADENFGLRLEDIAPEKPKNEDEMVKIRQHNDKRKQGKFEISEGDKILVKYGITGKKRNMKGPFLVTKIKKYGDNPKTLTYVDNNGKEQIAHISNIALYHERSRDLDE